MNEIPTIGIDLGYGRVKIAGPGYRESFPAVVAEPGVWSDPTGLVEWRGNRFLVGEPALAQPHHRYATRLDKIATPDEEAKFLTAIARASVHYDTRVLQLVTGLPATYYKDASLREQLRDRLTGTFQFWHENEPFEVAVTDVKVDPQAGAAYYDFLLDDDGEVAAADLLEMQTMVIDPGHRTTDIALMAGRKAARGGRSIATVDQGVWTVYEEMGRILLQEHRISLTPAELDAYWRGGGTIRLAGEPISLEEPMAQALAPIGRAIASAATRHAGDIRLWDAVLLVGGGAPLFGPLLAKELAIPVRCAREPQYCNAAGYFKRAIER